MAMIHYWLELAMRYVEQTMLYPPFAWLQVRNQAPELWMIVLSKISQRLQYLSDLSASTLWLFNIAMENHHF